MKTKTTFLKATLLIVALSMLTVANAQTLVAHYEFNGGYTSSSGTYTDELQPAEYLTKTTYNTPLTYTSPFSFTTDNNANANAALNVDLYDTDGDGGAVTPGENKAFLVGSNNLGLSGNTSRTYTVWFKVPADAGNNFFGIIDTGNHSGGGGARFTVLLNDANLINVGFRGNGYTTNTAVADDTWTFFAVTYDSATNQASSYLTAGADLTTPDISHNPTVTINTLDAPLVIGSTTVDYGRGFIGQIADVRLYEGVLSVAQINQVKNGATLGTKDLAFSKDELKVFPTQVEDYLNIKTTVSGRPHVTIYNMIGKSVKKEFSNTIDMSDLASGLYIVNVRVGDKVGNLKVVKQ